MYLLNNIDISTFGMIASQVSGSNIALSGWCDLPIRTGDTHYSWAEEDSVEPYVDEDDIAFEGRDLVLKAIILGSNFDLYPKLRDFYAFIASFTELVTLSTPYGDFEVYVKDVKESHSFAACELEITFREPVVTINGTIPTSSAIEPYTIDSVPFSAYGLYVNKSGEVYNLPEAKEQFFTKYKKEGYQITKREYRTLTIDGYVMASSLNDFKTKVANLQYIFSCEGERQIKKNNEIVVTCFAKDGFSINEIFLLTNSIISKFSISLVVTGFDYGNKMLYENNDFVIDESGMYILI